jgi:hypothetical protein
VPQKAFTISTVRFFFFFLQEVHHWTISCTLQVLMLLYKKQSYLICWFLPL